VAWARIEKNSLCSCFAVFCGEIFAFIRSVLGETRKRAQILVSLYGSGQYRWHADGPDGRPLRNLPPTLLQVRADQPINIRAGSLVVIR